MRVPWLTVTICEPDGNPVHKDSHSFPSNLDWEDAGIYGMFFKDPTLKKVVLTQEDNSSVVYERSYREVE